MPSRRNGKRKENAPSRKLRCTESEELWVWWCELKSTEHVKGQDSTTDVSCTDTPRKNASPRQSAPSANTSTLATSANIRRKLSQYAPTVLETIKRHLENAREVDPHRQRAEPKRSYAAATASKEKKTTETDAKASNNHHDVAVPRRETNDGTDAAVTTDVHVDDCDHGNLQEGLIWIDDQRGGAP